MTEIELINSKRSAKRQPVDPCTPNFRAADRDAKVHCMLQIVLHSMNCSECFSFLIFAKIFDRQCDALILAMPDGTD